MLDHNKSAIELKPRSRSYKSERNLTDIVDINLTSQDRRDRQQLTKVKYSPIGSSRKLNLLLQRSLRYSYRQRCCGCCPTILCELLFPFIIIALLTLARYGSNAAIREINANPDSIRGSSNRFLCSQDKNTTTTYSRDILRNCFKFPPSYKGRRWMPGNSDVVSNQTNIIFQPMTNETKELVTLAENRLAIMNCNNTKIW